MTGRRRLGGGLLVAAGLLGSLGGDAAAQTARLRYLAAIYVDDKGTGMRRPEGVACDERSVLIVGDTGGGRLLRYTIDDLDVKAAGEIVAPQLSAPIRVQLNSKEEIYVLDGKQRRVLRFGPKGEFRGPLAPEGVPGAGSIVPRSLKVDRNDTVYLLDIFSARVLVLDAAGKYQRHLPFPAEYGFFSDLAVDGKGTVYLLDSLRATLHAAPRDAKEFSPLTKPLREYASFPTSLATDGRGVLYLVDENGGGVVLVGQDGAVLGRQLAMGWNEGYLYQPAQMCLNERGQAFIADRGNNRVQVFSVGR